MSRILILISLLFLFTTQSRAGPLDPTIRILHVYTPEFASTTSNIASLVDTRISQLNKALSDSKVYANVASVGVVSIPSLPDDHTYAYAQIRSSYSVQKERDVRNADIIMILAYDIHASSVQIIDPEHASDAMAIIAGGDLNNYPYIHEFGHLLGARHQSTGAIDTKFNDPLGNGHGYYMRVRLSVANACSNTVMAYPPNTNLHGVNCSYSALLPLFSNPLTCDDYTTFYSPTGAPLGCLPWGDGFNNNAAVMNSRVAKVANFRTSKYSRKLLMGRLTAIWNSLF